ncbi:MAG: hypothetical protein HKN79_10220, partial [Flavobacteriales bacterium]|nr:hypothetical protein [Flavobacteriales bacterium]
PYLFYRGGAGFSFCAETNLAIVLKYMYGVGVPFSKSEDGESLKFNTHTLSIGVQWSFRKCDYCYSKRYR